MDVMHPVGILPGTPAPPPGDAPGGLHGRSQPAQRGDFRALLNEQIRERETPGAGRPPHRRGVRPDDAAERDGARTGGGDPWSSAAPWSGAGVAPPIATGETSVSPGPGTVGAAGLGQGPDEGAGLTPPSSTDEAVAFARAHGGVIDAMQGAPFPSPSAGAASGGLARAAGGVLHLASDRVLAAPPAPAGGGVSIPASSDPSVLPQAGIPSGAPLRPGAPEEVIGAPGLSRGDGPVLGPPFLQGGPGPGIPGSVPAVGQAALSDGDGSGPEDTRMAPAGRLAKTGAARRRQAASREHSLARIMDVARAAQAKPWQRLQQAEAGGAGDDAAGFEPEDDGVESPPADLPAAHDMQTGAAGGTAPAVGPGGNSGLTSAAWPTAHDEGVPEMTRGAAAAVTAGTRPGIGGTEPPTGPIGASPVRSLAEEVRRSIGFPPAAPSDSQAMTGGDRETAGGPSPDSLGLTQGADGHATSAAWELPSPWATGMEPEAVLEQEPVASGHSGPQVTSGQPGGLNGVHPGVAGEGGGGETSDPRDDEQRDPSATPSWTSGRLAAGETASGVPLASAAPGHDGLGTDGGFGLIAGQAPLSSAGAGPETAGAEGATRASVMEQLAAHVQEMVASWRQEVGPDGAARVSIRLHPEHLGEVVLRISVDPSGSVTARFAVENPQVRAWIEHDLPQLRAALAEHGLQLVGAGVDSGPGSDGGHNPSWFDGGAGASTGSGTGHSEPQPDRQAGWAPVSDAVSLEALHDDAGGGDDPAQAPWSLGQATRIDVKV